LEGNVGVLFTNRTDKEVMKYFKNFSVPEFAKAGTVPEETIVLPIGELPTSSFPVSMLDELRKLGMIVEVDNAKVVLRETYTAAEAGVPLTPEQARILVKLDRPIVKFTIQMLCRWENGNFHEL
jgi:mRNA turnover protein 4